VHISRAIISHKCMYLENSTFQIRTVKIEEATWYICPWHIPRSTDDLLRIMASSMSYL